MKLTKLFAMFVMAFSIFAITSAIAPSRSSAQDVWIMSRDGFDYYMSTETIAKKDRGYGVNVKLVHNGKFHNFKILNFFSANDSYMVMEEFTRYDGKWTVIDDKELGAPLWRAMKKYMKANGIPCPNLDYM